MKKKYNKYGHHRKKEWPSTKIGFLIKLGDKLTRKNRFKEMFIKIKRFSDDFDVESYSTRTSPRIKNIECYRNPAIKCPNGCESEFHKWYNETWDRVFCRPCDIWLEKGCSVKPDDNIDAEGFIKCYFNCWDCPPKPSDAFIYE